MREEILKIKFVCRILQRSFRAMWILRNVYRIAKDRSTFHLDLTHGVDK